MVKDEPEALYTIMKYNIIQKCPSYTFDSLDDEYAENVGLISLCIEGENKALEMAQKKSEFTEGR